MLFHINRWFLPHVIPYKPLVFISCYSISIAGFHLMLFHKNRWFFLMLFHTNRWFFLMLFHINRWFLSHAIIYKPLVFISCYYIQTAGIYLMLYHINRWFISRAIPYKPLVYISCYSI